MKVIFLIDSLEGYGAEKSIVQIALHMEQVTPVFIHLYKGDKLKSSLELRGIQVYSLELVSEFRFKEAINSIIPIINKEKPEIIHSTLFRADLVARKLKQSFPHIILVGSFVSNSYGVNRYKQLPFISRIKLFSTQLRDRMTASKVDFFVCNSKAIKKSNIRALGISGNKVKVIYRGRRFEDYLPSTKAFNLLKKEFNLEEHQVFLNVSRLHKGKGQLDLLNAFKVLNAQNPNTVLFIAGEGSFRMELEDLINSLSLENNVFLLGYREDIPELLAISDYFVFTSYFEGLPGALIEAIISKTPSIVSDIPENRECFLENGALFYKSGNILELSKKMEEALIINNWQEKVNASYKYAEENFDIAKVSLQYENFYKEIISGSK
ncbi:glycosyltransferase involved in cell wall biosynthesis [Gillisia mitskevichiae]|uniref:Glycosyltransferase involved in cell wall biosynthesis n=1 Tax=Gillisia mitskevichiae TaxID=270921 RepID=A0A495PM90_9FLAO|nr:glycosyltransferase [Gillisia mitskevichiae]RKS50578.1 glycosyltransferase involved in cell wall biosynthesis [Gillisia mitskevichiae]